ncbi:box C/D snoRNA protein 1 [Lutzomyia longipalpis]|uniref:box C/D snoRNA protein 1 n=1 Tax=Lutzomyia longipalpis TaxID=7200 RepID=UPI0024833686|nr:box C/D snoRNA protein 1 [Lutzomyia longipalpis]
MDSCEDQSGNQSKTDTCRLGMCEVCQVTDAKYTCPRCEVKTCSLPCLNIHKKELECSGLRDKTRYIPIKKMTTMDYMSDYNFLEECTRFVHKRKRSNGKHLHGDLPQHLHRLRMIVRQRKIQLQFLGRNFTKRKMNGTYYDGRARRIFWTVEWMFLHAEKSIVEKKCRENETLGKLLGKYVDVQHSGAQHEELEHYRSRGFGGLKVLLKSERIKNCGKRFYEMDLRKSLEENLCGKNIVEFPTFLVIFKELHGEFDMIDSDEEDSRELERCSNKSLENEKTSEEPPQKDADHVGRTNFLFTDESIWENLSSDEEATNAEKVT